MRYIFVILFALCGVWYTDLLILPLSAGLTLSMMIWFEGKTIHRVKRLDAQGFFGASSYNSLKLLLLGVLVLFSRLGIEFGTINENQSAVITIYTSFCLGVAVFSCVVISFLFGVSAGSRLAGGQ